MFADLLMKHGTLIGCFEEWELWELHGRRYHVNLRTYEVIDAV